MSKTNPPNTSAPEPEGSPPSLRELGSPPTPETAAVPAHPCSVDDIETSAAADGPPTAVDKLPIEPARAWGDSTLWLMFRRINPKWFIAALVVAYLAATFTINVVISRGALVAIMYAGSTLILMGTSSALIMSSIRMEEWDRWWKRTHLILLEIHMNQMHDGLSPFHVAGCRCTYINGLKGPALVTLPHCKRIPWGA